MPRLYNFKTNSYEEIPENLIREKVLSRQYAFADTEKIPVIAPDGSRHFIPGINAREAFSRGGNYGSTKDWARIGRKEEYGEDSWGNYIAAAATGLARGGTLGMSDIVLREILGKERMQTWREEFPGTSVGFEVGGAALPALFSGGASTAGTGARLAAKGIKASDLLIASKGVFKAGRYLEKGLGGAALASRAGNKATALRILQGTGAKGLAGMSEGALFGAGTTLTESMLGDPEDVGELLMANMGYSALFGGVGNAGIHMIGVTGVAAGKGMSNGIASLYKKATGSDLSIAGQKKFSKWSSGVLGQDPDILEKQVAPYAYKKRAEAYAAEKTFKGKQDNIVSSINSVLDDLAVVTKNSRGLAKRQGIRESIFRDTAEEADPTAALNRVADLLKGKSEAGNLGLLDAIDDLTKKAGAFRWLGKGDEVAKNVRSADNMLENILSGNWGESVTPQMAELGVSPSRDEIVNKWLRNALDTQKDDTIKEIAKDAFLMLDDYKKHTAYFVWGEGRSKIPSTTWHSLNNSWRHIHGILEDASIWGKAAEIQATVNPQFTALLTSMQKFVPKFGYAGAKGEIVSTEKIGRWLKKVEGRTGEGMEASWGKEADEIFDGFFKSADSFAGAANKAYGWAGAETTKEASEAAVRLRHALGTTLDMKDSLVNEMRETAFIRGAVGGPNYEPQLAATILRSFGGAAFGGVAFGTVGAAAGLILGGLADSASTARKLAAFESMVIRSRKALNDGLDGVMDRMARGGPGGTIPLRPNRTKLFLAPLAKQLGEDAAEKESTKAKDYTAAKERAMRLMDPQVLSGAINKVTEPIDYEMPNLAEAVKSKLAGGVRFASEGFKKDNRTNDDILMGVKEREPTDREMAQQEQRVAMLEDPINETMTNLENGTLTGVQVDMLEKVYPSIYASIVAGMAERVSDMENPPAYAWRNTLSILFKRPLDVSHKPENIDTLQASYAVKQDEGNKIKSTPILKHPGIGPTEVQRLMAG